MTPTVSDIIRLIEQIALAHLAESWDNCGLQVGRGQWPVKHIRTALDPLPQVVSDAAEAGVDFLVTHHPLIFRPVKQVDFGSDLGRIIRQAADHHLSIYAAHTNLDKAQDGLNDMLAALIGLEALEPLVAGERTDTFKLVFFVPMSHIQAVTDVLVETGAGRIGSYSGCTFRSEGVGTFIPGPGTNPFTGEQGRLNKVAEMRIETVLAGADIEQVVAAVQTVHPYESMAYDVYRVVAMDRPGLGRVGRLPDEMKLGEFAQHVARELSLDKGVRLVGDPQSNISRVAVCTGSGSSLTGDFMASGADVYVSGDMHYHDAQSIEAAGRGLVDVGHFASERIMVPALADRLRREIAAAGFDTVVSTSTVETDPFKFVTVS